MASTTTSAGAASPRSRWWLDLPAMARLGLAVALAILLVDQLSKAWLIVLLGAPGETVELAPFFNLVMVWNRGVSFGLGGAAGLGPWPFVALSGAITVALLVWLRRAETRLLGLAIGAVVGGAIGNMIDRVRYGAVADFFDLHLAGYHWPAFNVADSAIVIGVGVIVLDAFLHRGEGNETRE